MPRFSWATLSVAYHPSNSTGHYTPEQLRTLAARFAMVTLEKWTGVDAYVPSATLAAPSYESPGGLYGCQRGSNLSRCGCCAEDAIVTAAAAIKRIDPSVMTVAYLNFQIAYPWYRAARDVAAHPEWWLRDVRHPGPAGSSWQAYDLTIPAASASWKASCHDLVRSGAVDRFVLCRRLHQPVRRPVGARGRTRGGQAPAAVRAAGRARGAAPVRLGRHTLSLPTYAACRPRGGACLATAATTSPRAR